MNETQRRLSERNGELERQADADQLRIAQLTVRAERAESEAMYWRGIVQGSKSE